MEKFTLDSNINNRELDISCPHCGNMSRQIIGWLKTSPSVTCLVCDKEFIVDGQKFKAGISEADKALDEFMSDIRKLFK